MSDEGDKKARIPPRWFVRAAWSTHRVLYSATRGRVGLRRAKSDRWGMMRLTTTGRRTDQERSVILGYVNDGPNLVTLAMNGWANSDPAWWLNLQAHPEATVDLADGRRAVTGRAAEGEDRSRLWARWRELDTNLDAYAALRSAETAIVILEPRSNTER
jgi:deazaflavin-dependent oxidoreductase (nitroreductase family)